MLNIVMFSDCKYIKKGKIYPAHQYNNLGIYHMMDEDQTKIFVSVYGEDSHFDSHWLTIGETYE